MTVVKAVVERLNATGNRIHRRDEQIIAGTVSRNGGRMVDDAKIEFSIKTVVNQNDNVKYIQDVVDTEYLSGIWNFQASGKDESGYDQHATVSGTDPGIDRFILPNSSGNLGKFRAQYGLTFDNTGQTLTVPSTLPFYNRLDFSRQFDIYVWCQFNFSDNYRSYGDGDSAVIFSTSGLDIGIKNVGGENRLLVRTVIGGTVTEYVGTRVLFGNTLPTMIRVTRNDTGTLTGYANGIYEFHADLGDATLDDHSGIQFGDTKTAESLGWIGQVFQIRTYCGTYLSDDDAETIRLAYPQPVTMKLDGKVWKVDNDTNPIKCYVKGEDKILLEANMTRTSLTGNNAFRTGNVYDAGTDVNDMLADMISGVDSEFTVKAADMGTSDFEGKFVATQGLIQCVDLILLETQRLLTILPNKIIIIEDSGGVTTPYIFTQGVPNQPGYIITNSGKDDIVKINDIELIGRVRFKHGRVNDNITASNRTVTLSQFPLDLRITAGAEILSENQQYSVDYEARQVTFNQNSGNVTIEYNYEDLESNTPTRLYCRTEDKADIAAAGRYSRRIFVPQLTHSEDIDQAAQRMRLGFAGVKERYELIIPGHANHLIENRNIGIQNTIKGINVTAPVRSVSWTYPEMRTTVEVGEYKFDQFDAEHVNVVGITATLASTIKTHNSGMPPAVNP